ncbi:MAG: hypothetical protein N3C12_01795 [Candidatus Binatia bacterium]|nr:hypothetical protein [Candidatus Binatia bacterium]
MRQRCGSQPRPRARRAIAASARLTSVVVLALCAGLSLSAWAQPLNERIPSLFGGAFRTSITPLAFNDVQQPRVADQFRALSAALATARAQVPPPSATGAFRFEFDDASESYVRRAQSLGPSLAERATTLGARTISLGFSYTRIDFDTLEGSSLRHLRSVQPALSAGFLEQLPEEDRLRAADNLLETNLDFRLGFDLWFLTAAYGLTDSIDVSISLSLARARMKADARAVIRDPNGDGGVFFTVDQRGVVVDNLGTCPGEFLCAVDHFDANAFGTGDIYLRSKWHVGEFRWADVALAQVTTLPTGRASDLLGFRDPTFTPWLILSKQVGDWEPHLNLGYALRSRKDVSQAQWIAGADWRAAPWLTLAVDFLGFHDDWRDGVNDNVFQSALGFKANPFGQWVVGGNVQLPLNRDGLRADVIYSVQLEYAW